MSRFKSGLLVEAGRIGDIASVDARNKCGHDKTNLISKPVFSRHGPT
jgi:hypothetical protein